MGGALYIVMEKLQQVLYNVFKEYKNMEGAVVWKREEGFFMGLK